MAIQSMPPHPPASLSPALLPSPIALQAILVVFAVIEVMLVVSVFLFTAEALFFSMAILLFRMYLHIPSLEPGGQWIETTRGWVWEGDPCTCRGGTGCPQCDVTRNCRAFLITHMFLVAVYVGLRLVALAPCSKTTWTPSAWCGSMAESTSSSQ